MSATPETLLHDELLERMRERAAGYDRDNAFFDEDLAELRDAGYLTALVPEGYGGLGWGFDEAVRAQCLAGFVPSSFLPATVHERR